MSVPGWFVVNVADAPAESHERAGVVVPFEPPGEPFPDFGINIHVLQPGQPNGKYHYESVQQDFLVLSGECLAILEGEERRLHAWDFVHCPAGTAHAFVGAGQGPCAILMVGARRPGKTPALSAERAGGTLWATAPAPTSSPAEAYADWASELTSTRVPWPPA
jgi:quercetin dioxygenase-like cupin family protein